MMAAKFYLRFIFLSVTLTHSVGLTTEGYFTSSPQNVTVFVGNYVRLHWDFIVRPEDALRRIRFGTSDGHSLIKGLAVKIRGKNGLETIINSAYPEYENRINVETDTSTILVSNLTASDSGFYVCVLDIGLFHPLVSSHVYIKVTDILIDNSTSTTAVKTWFHRKIKLVCSTTTVSTPSFKWYRKSDIGGKITVITEGITSRHSKSILKLQVTDVKDFGVYTCNASTKVASVSHDIIVSKLDPPSAPHALHFKVWSETSEEKGVELKWFAPDTDGGLPISNYTVEKREQGTDIWEQALITSTTTGFLSNLSGKKNFEIRIQANNDVGSGEFSKVLALILIAPSKPVSVSYTIARVDGTKVIRLVWDPPQYNNGAPVLEYVVEKRFYGAFVWRLATKTQFTYVDVFLDYSRNHQLRVLSRSTAGNGDPSDVLDVIWLNPGPPQSLNYKIENENGTKYVQVTWKAHDRGKSSVTEFIVKMRIVGTAKWAVAARTKSNYLLLKNLDHSYDYQIKVFSVNSLGYSEPSHVMDIPLGYSVSGQTSGCEHVFKINSLIITMALACLLRIL